MADKTPNAPESAPVASPAQPRLTVTHETASTADWPEPSAWAGDGDRIAHIAHHVKQLTDVGSLDAVLRAVLAQAKLARVRPDVLQATVRNALKDYDARSHAYEAPLRED